MKTRKFLVGLIFSVVLTGCGGTSLVTSDSVSEEPSGSEFVSEIPGREDVHSPTIEFTPSGVYTGDFWNTVNLDLRGLALRDELRSYMRTKFVGVDYNTAGQAVREMDADPNNPGAYLSLYDLESHTGSFGTWNREHVFPQSKLADGDDSKRAKSNVVNISSDIANLFVCDWALNEQRSNYSFAEWNYEDDPDLYYDFTTRNTAGKLTDSIVRRGYHSPTRKVRGEVARSQLYMLVMWPDECSIFENFAISTMLKWDRELVPTIERDELRQTGLLKYQKIRNPFIDLRDLSCHIWGDTDVSTRRICESVI